MTWVFPCTLPTMEQPARLAEFDELFRTAICAVTRVDGSRARFVLRPESAIAGRAAELAVRESGCCSFFEFSLTVAGGSVSLDVRVPSEQLAVPDAWTDRARVTAGLVSP